LKRLLEQPETGSLSDRTGVKAEHGRDVDAEPATGHGPPWTGVTAGSQIKPASSLNIAASDSHAATSTLNRSSHKPRRFLPNREPFGPMNNSSPSAEEEA
jgi:hypothetical protein